MSSLNDNLLLSQIALPGTHDSAAYGDWISSVKTQSLNFNEQLKYGIRVFDIRVRHTNNRFALHHGPVYLNVMFDSFLSNVNDFLKNNPSETVLFRLKEEWNADNNNTRELAETLQHYVSQYPDTFLKTTDTSLTLQKTRGKFIILSDHRQFAAFGLPYSSFRIQDDYSLSSNWDLYKKWESIKSHLSTSMSGDRSKFHVNYLSGSGGSLPYFVASGHSSSGTNSSRLSTGKTTPLWKNAYPDFPRVNCFIGMCTIAFEGTNVLTNNRLKAFNILKGNPEKDRAVGIIYADFPGDGLISNIIANNHRVGASL